jgi:cytoskeleton protein RodZ
MNQQVPGKQPADAANDAPGASAAADPGGFGGSHPPLTPVATEAGIGARLRAIRDVTGLSREEFARKARIPTAVLGDLESGQLSRLGAAVYVRGYVRSVARAAGVDDSELMLQIQQLDDAQGPQQPATVAPRMSSGAPRWVSRYATPVAYALLTAVVMVPVVYLARPGGSELAQVPSLTPIDAPQRSESTVPGLVSTPAPGAQASTTAALDLQSLSLPAPVTPDATQMGPPAVPAASPRPVMATFAPMPEATPGKLSQRVTLRLRAPSWVEFTGSDGSRLEYALLPAGTNRDYQLQGSAELRIGNSSGAELSVDGKPVDLVSISRANVAIVVLGKPQTPATD